MKLLILTVLSLFVLTTCAFNEKIKGKAYNKHCAMSVSEDDINVEGDRDCKLKHNGKIFYFSSRKKMEEFEEELKNNVSDEEEIWSVMGRP